MLALLFITQARLVSLSPTVTEIVCALDACDQLVGVTRFDDYPPQVTSLPRVGGYSDPSFEATVRLKPDLVLLNKNGTNQGFAAALDKARIRYLPLTDESLGDFTGMTRQIGDAIGKHEKATALIASFNDGLARLKGKASVRSAVFVYGHRPLIVGGPGTFGAELLALAGIKNAYQGKQKYPSLDLEALIALEPGVIIDVDMIAGQSETTYYDPAQNLLRKIGTRIIYAPDPALLRLGPRLPDAMARLLQRMAQP